MASAAVPVLYNLYIYTNEECNLACKHCWVTAKLSNSVRRRFVDLAAYQDFIDQAVPLGLGYVKISGGEALLSKHEVLGIVRHTHKRGVATRIETNGTLIDEEVARTFRETNTAVSISLDGSTAELHEAMRLVPGSFDATMRGLELTRKYKIPVEIIMSVYKDNEHDLPNVIKIASTLYKGRVKINPVLATGRGWQMEKKGERLTAVQLHNFVRKIETEYIKFGVPVLVSAEPAFHSLDYIVRRLVGGGKCGFKSLLGILANGNVSFCGMGYRFSRYVFGRVGDFNLTQAWATHPVLQEVRSQIPDKLEGICGNCMLKASCQGACRSSAFDRYGSITAPSPGCQELYEAGLFPKSRMVDPTRDCSFSPTAEPALSVLN